MQKQNANHKKTETNHVENKIMQKTERKSCRKQNANHVEHRTQIMQKTERK